MRFHYSKNACFSSIYIHTSHYLYAYNNINVTLFIVFSTKWEGIQCHVFLFSTIVTIVFFSLIIQNKKNSNGKCDVVDHVLFLKQSIRIKNYKICTILCLFLTPPKFLKL